MSLLFLVAAHAVAVAEPLSFRSEASIHGDIVRLSDVADLSGLPAGLRERTAAIPIARLRSREQVLSSRTVARRARGSVPALTAWLPNSPDQPIRIRSTGPAEQARADAEAAVAPVSGIRAGEPVTLHVQVGPVVVEREVTALQTARPGRPVFVRTADGVVLSARWGGAR